MKTVLFIVNHNITIYNFRKELAERLVVEGYRVIVVLPVTEETQKISELGCEVIDVPVERRGTNPVHDFKLFLTYRKILKKIRPDVVLTYTIKPNVYGGLAADSLKIPYLCTVTGLGVAIEGGGLLKKISLMLYKAGLSGVSKIFFQNADNRKVFEDAHIGKGRYELVSGSGVNIEDFKRIPFPSSEEKAGFVFISRVQRAKGIENYLEMAQEIKGKYPDTVFHILGFCEEDYKEKLEKLTKEGVICYHGMQQDIRPVLERCQCLVHPSFHEGMSNVCMEAAAAGRAVIASDISGCREIIEEGVTGFLVKPGDTQDLVRAVEYFLNLRYNEKMQMGEAGRMKMSREFDRKNVVSKYMEEIKKIIG
ncbi:MAG: glycosyltransferase family 4 protein [Lachnospiraceae bacterium]|nr:glycosyltransferase family 4 protein [Lachnospiraceae bacterium]